MKSKAYYKPISFSKFSYYSLQCKKLVLYGFIVETKYTKLLAMIDSGIIKYANQSENYPNIILL